LVDKIADVELSQLVMKFCVEDSNEFPSIVGYKPTSDVTRVSVFAGRERVLL
jgi:hypothetical protein